MPPEGAVVTRMWTRRFKSIGFVDQGACEGADIVNAKRDTAEASKMVKKDGDEWVVLDADGKTELGRHKSKAKAQAQAAAIEANASKRAPMADGGDWADVLKLAGATARPQLDAVEALFWSTAQKAEEGCAPKTFNEVEDLAAVRDEMWKVWDRFRTSVCSIIESDADTKAELLATSVNEFQAFLTEAAPKWAAGATAMKEAPMATPAKTDKADATKTDAQKGAAVPTPLTAEARKALTPEALAYVEQLEAATTPIAGVAGGAAGSVSKADHDTAIAAKDTEIGTLKAKLAAADPSAGEDEVLKGMSPAAAEAFKAMRKTTDDALKVATEERELREVGEAVTAAKAYSLVAPAEKMGPILRRVEKGLSTPEDATELRRVLKGASEIAEKSKLFVPMGDDDKGGNGTAIDEVQKRIPEVRKADPKLSQSQALIAVLDADPDLASRYRAEKRQAH